MALDNIIQTIRQEVLSDLLSPSSLTRVADLPKNDYGQPSFGTGNLVVGYSVSGVPLICRVSGSDDSMDLFSTGVVDAVRVVNVNDESTASELATFLTTLFPMALEETNRRRIRRAAAASSPRDESIPEGHVRDPKTGEIRPRRKPGPKK